MRFLQVIAAVFALSLVVGCSTEPQKGAIEATNKAAAPPKGVGSQTVTNADGTTSTGAAAGGETVPAVD